MIISSSISVFASESSLEVVDIDECTKVTILESTEEYFKIQYDYESGKKEVLEGIVKENNTIQTKIYVDNDLESSLIIGSEQSTVYDNEQSALLQNSRATNGEWQKTGSKKFGEIKLGSANSVAGITQTILDAVIVYVPEAAKVAAGAKVISQTAQTAYNKTMKGIWGIEDRYIMVNEYPLQILMKHYLKFYSDNTYRSLINGGWTADHIAG